MAQKLIRYMISIYPDAIQACIPAGTCGKVDEIPPAMCVKRETDPVQAYRFRCRISGFLFDSRTCSPNYSNPLFHLLTFRPLKKLLPFSLSGSYILGLSNQVKLLFNLLVLAYPWDLLELDQALPE